MPQVPDAFSQWCGVVAMDQQVEVIGAGRLRAVRPEFPSEF